jgi:hypothetical protein
VHLVCNSNVRRVDLVQLKAMILNNTGGLTDLVQLD